MKSFAMTQIKRISWLGAALVLSVMVASCGKAAAPANNTPAPTTDTSTTTTKATTTGTITTDTSPKGNVYLYPSTCATADCASKVAAHAKFTIDLKRTDGAWISVGAVEIPAGLVGAIQFPVGTYRLTPVVFGDIDANYTLPAAQVIDVVESKDVSASFSFIHI